MTKEEIFDKRIFHLPMKDEDLLRAVYESMDEYAKQQNHELLEALQLIMQAFPESVMEDQMGEDFFKVQAAIKKASTNE